MAKDRQILNAAIYDRWLYTLGGGEQVAFAYAETLRDLGYNTTILTHKAVDLAKAEKKMGAQLHNISIKYLPPCETKELSQYTEDYDVFINTSYADYFPNRAKVGILSVFFPSQIFLTPFEYLKRAFFIPSLRKFFIYPTNYEGFLYDDFSNGKIYKWLSHESKIYFNHHIKKLELVFFLVDLQFSIVDNLHFFLNGEEIPPTSRHLHHQKNHLHFFFDFKKSNKMQVFSIIPSHDSKVLPQIALTRLTIPGWRYLFYNLFKTLFPKWEMRLHGGPGVTKLSDILSYDQIITISEFCKHWIHKYWGIPSQILYPPVNVERFKPAAKKKPWIIHVGRFFVSGHNKKQLEMVKIFRQMVDAGQLKDWELHLVGSIHEGERHQSYFEEVKKQAEGYNVVFHTDTPLTELQKLLGQASIYWHATGLDEDIDSNPIVFEHFGITTVEAMSAGCVPIVIDAGGQKEIVTAGAGFTWSDRKEWKELTSRVVEDESLRAQLSLGAQKRSQHFSRSAFEKRFAALVRKKK